MREVKLRRSFTSSGYLCFSPWNDERFIYSIVQINLGSNPLSNVEIVSTLNVLNLGAGMYGYNYADRPQKYNPKVFLGSIQGVAQSWFYDNQYPGSNTASDPEKSGSLLNIIFSDNFARCLS